MNKCYECGKSFVSIDYSQICLSCAEDKYEAGEDWMHKEVKQTEHEVLNE